VTGIGPRRSAHLECRREMDERMRITVVRLPIDWESFGLPASFTASGVLLTSGPRAWAWEGVAPRLHIRAAPDGDGTVVPGWGLDHVVVLVPDLKGAVEVMTAAGLEPRKRMLVRERPTAFFLAGVLIEVIEETTVDGALLWGLALETSEPLESVANRWAAAGHEVTGPRPAYQRGRSILTVRDAGAGLAVMTLRER
jgi:hypothetical protein